MAALVCVSREGPSAEEKEAYKLRRLRGQVHGEKEDTPQRPEGLTLGPLGPGGSRGKCEEKLSQGLGRGMA